VHAPLRTIATVRLAAVAVVVVVVKVCVSRPVVAQSHEWIESHKARKVNVISHYDQVTDAVVEVQSAARVGRDQDRGSETCNHSHRQRRLHRTTVCQKL